MRTSFAIAFAIVIALMATSAFGADVTGKWTGDIPDAGFTLNFEFHQDGATLTGTSQGPDGSAINISQGKVEGDKLSFVVELADMGMTVIHEGTIAGEEITLSARIDGGDDMGPIKLKRVK